MNAKETPFEDIDAVIVSVLIDTEHPALMAAFELDPFNAPYEQRENLKFYFTELETIQGKRLKIVLTCFGDKGNVDSRALTTKILELTKPKYLYLVGTAGGREDRVSICDVVVSTQGIMSYGRGRVKEGVTGSRPEFVYVDGAAKNEVKSFYTAHMKSLGWSHEYASTLETLKRHFSIPPLTREPEVHFEAIASGEMILNSEMLKSVCDCHDSVYAVEMEGYGFAKACCDWGTSWLVIRGVSDYGKREEKENWQIPATVMACSFLKIFLKHAFQPPRQIETLPKESLYVREKIPDLMREALRVQSIDISPIKFSLDLTINELERICHILYPDIPVEELRQTVRKARATAFEKKYANRTQEDDERFMDIERWNGEFWSQLFHLDIRDLKTLKVVNVGIGNGLEGRGLYDDVDSFIGVDISEKALKDAKRHFPKMQCIVNDAEDLGDVGNSSQDVYISLRTYQSTLFDIKSALLEAYRVLRSGGTFLISIPYVFIGENKRMIKGLLLPESDEVDPDLPYTLVDKVRRGLNLLNFDRIGIHTGMFEVYVYGQKGR